MCITFYPCAEPVCPGVYWRNDRNWEMYDMATTKKILLATEEKNVKVDIGGFKSPIYPGGARYEADLSTMQQYNVRSGQPRAIRIIKDPGSTPYLSDFDVKKMFDQVRKTIVDFYTSESVIREAVNKKLTDEGAIWTIGSVRVETASLSAFEDAIHGLVPQDINVLLATAKRVESLDYVSNKIEYLFTSENACGESSRDLFKMPSEALASAEGRTQKLRITLSLMANAKGRAGSTLPTRYAMLVAVVRVFNVSRYRDVGLNV